MDLMVIQRSTSAQQIPARCPKNQTSVFKQTSEVPGRPAEFYKALEQNDSAAQRANRFRPEFGSHDSCLMTQNGRKSSGISGKSDEFDENGTTNADSNRVMTVDEGSERPDTFVDQAKHESRASRLSR